MPREMIEARRVTLVSQDDFCIHGLLRSIRIGADRLAALAGRESLIDPETRAGPEGHTLVDVVPVHAGLSGVRVDRPGIDRLLEEADRAIAEGEVGPTGVEAGRGF